MNEDRTEEIRGQAANGTVPMQRNPVSDPMTAPELAQASFSLRLLGPFAACVNGAPLPPLRTRKEIWLLGLLVLHHPRPLDRTWLAGLLWPNSGEAAALTNLRKSLQSLRRVLGSEAYRLLSPAPRTLALDLAGADVDLLAFDVAMARGDPACLAAAVALYRGPLLDGCLAEWALPERRSREQACLQALQTLAEQARADGEPALAERYLRQAIAIDPLYEDAPRALMRLLAEGGSSAAALLVYHELRRRLHQEFHAEPDAETTALFQRLRAQARTTASARVTRRPTSKAAAPRPPGGARRHNLPAQPTPLVGREQEVAAARDLLRHADVRLVTLTGPGGTGKTRLALQVASELLETFDQGVFFVSLASIRDPTLIPLTIAQALGLQERGDRSPWQRLKESLCDRDLLLVADNFEQLVAAAPLLAELLAAAPRLKLLVTSRAVLHLRGEHEFPVPPLALPDRERLPSLDALSRVPAVALFLQRARAVRTEFALTDENAAAVAAICWRLDGLPLAIELAASRMKLFSAEELLARLVGGAVGDLGRPQESSLYLLVGGPRDLPARQQTLRDTIAWSYDLLEESEKRLFAQLTVFEGGFTAEAVMSVCCPSPRIIGRDKLLDLLASLVDQSLLWRIVAREAHRGRAVNSAGGEPRFTMLETIREYGQACLAEDEEAIRRRHASYFLDMTEEGAVGLQGPDAVRWLDRLATEHDNLRAALSWCAASETAEIGLRLAVALSRFWRMRGHLAEGREQLARLLALPGAGAHPALRARALAEAGWLAFWHQLDFPTAQALSEESLAIFRELGDQPGTASSLFHLGWFAHMQDDFATARPLLEQSLAIRRELGDPEGIAQALNGLGCLAYRQGDFPTSMRYHEEWGAICRQRGHRAALPSNLANRGLVAVQQDDGETAVRLWSECLAVSRELGDAEHAAASLDQLGRLAYRANNVEQARRFLTESVGLWRERDQESHLAGTLNSLGQVVLHTGDDAGAEAFWEESLDLARAVDNRQITAEALAGLGEIACVRGRPRAASDHYGASLALWQASDPGAVRQRGRGAGIARCLEGLAQVADMQGHGSRAARLLGAAEHLRASVGALLPLPERPAHERRVAAVHAALGHEAFLAAWTAGSGMPLEEAVCVALAESRPGRG
jgi:predicted ATPase/DNA-binding SARP family transcriptional activator